MAVSIKPEIEPADSRAGGQGQNVVGREGFRILASGVHSGVFAPLWQKARKRRPCGSEKNQNLRV